MSKSLLLIALISLWTLSCKQETTKIEYKLNDEQLSRLLFDIQLSEVAMKDLSVERKDSLKNMFWLRLSEIYKLSEPEIKIEIDKLETDPEKMKEIIDRIKMMSDSIR